MLGRDWHVHVVVWVVLGLDLDDLGASELEAGVDGAVRISLDKDVLLCEAKGYDLVSDGGAVLQEERQL